MGKVRRARLKAHNAAVKVKGDDKNSNKDTQDVQMEDDQNQSFGLPQMGSNLFDGLDLSKYDIKKQLPDFDTRSTITSKSLKGLNIKKKEKQKLRHDLWIKKLSAIDAAKKQAKDKKRKLETPVVGDIGALGEALPTLELLMKKSTGPRDSEENKKPKGIQKERKRKKQMMNDISLFHEVVKHPSFKDSPASTISEHLRNRQKQEDMQS